MTCDSCVLSLALLLNASMLGGVPAERGGHAREQAADEDLREDPEALLNEVVGGTVIYPQEQAELQFSLEPGYRDRREDRIGYVNWVVEIGATDWWQFELAWAAPTIHGGEGSAPVVGFGDFELGTQLTWMNAGRSPLSAALALEVEFPTARPSREPSPESSVDSDAGLGARGLSYAPFMTLALDLPGARGQLFTNLGAELGSEEQLPFVNVGLFVAAASLRPSLVFSWTPEQMILTPGVSVVAGEFWEFDLGVPIGLNSASDRLGVDLLVIYEFNPLELVRQ